MIKIIWLIYKYTSLFCEYIPIFLGAHSKTFMMGMVQNNGYILKYASDNLKDDKEVVTTAVQNYGYALRYASDDLKNDKEVVTTAVQNYAYALEYASDNLKNDINLIFIRFLQLDVSPLPIQIPEIDHKKMKAQILLIHNLNYPENLANIHRANDFNNKLQFYFSIKTNRQGLIKMADSSKVNNGYIPDNITITHIMDYLEVQDIVKFTELGKGLFNLTYLSDYYGRNAKIKIRDKIYNTKMILEFAEGGSSLNAKELSGVNSILEDQE